MAEATLADKLQSLTDKARGTAVRQSWVLSSNYTESGQPPIILSMSINPVAVKWSQSKRTSTARQTIGGTTYFHWSDRKGRNLNPAILTLSGETGPMSGLGKTFSAQQLTSILRSGDKVDPRALKHAQNFAKFYVLTAQPQIDPITYTPTVWTIQYKSIMFPDITLRGFWNQVLEFTDEASSTPFSRRWTAAFTVTGCDPDITKLQNLIGLVDLDLATVNAQAVGGEPSQSAGNIA